MEDYIKLCFSEAKKGIGKVSPNPLVGAVIVRNDKIISTGYHQKYGENHAEINALLTAGKKAEGAVLYLNLEPCSHYGKTPPCVDSIINSGIKKVVCSMEDPNPLVNGKGFEKLRQNGIEVVIGLLKDEAMDLNKSFIKFITMKQPFIHIKIVQSLNFKITEKTNERIQISSAETKDYINQLRNENDAVLIGAGTLKTDNPKLLLDESFGKQPIRIVLSKSFDFSFDSNIFNDNYSNLTYIFSSEKNKNLKILKRLEKKSINVLFVKESKDGKLNLDSIIKKLYELNIASVLIEGGNEINSSFISKGFFDEISIIITPKLFQKGTEAFFLNKSFVSKNINLKVDSIQKTGDDVIIKYKKQKLL